MAGSTATTLVLVPSPAVHAASAPRTRARRLRAVWHERYHAAGEALEAHTALAPGVRAQLQALHDQEGEAVQRWTAYLEGRLDRLTKQLRDALSTGAVTDQDARRGLLEALDGPPAAARDGALLSRSEGELLAAYRQLPPAVQAAVRTLAKASAADQARERAR